MSDIPSYLLEKQNAETKRWNTLKSIDDYLKQARALVERYEKDRADAMIEVRDKDNATLREISAFLGGSPKPERVSEIINNRRLEHQLSDKPH